MERIISKSITDLRIIVTSQSQSLTIGPIKICWNCWEIPAYEFVSFRLFRFWKGEKKPGK